MNLKDRIVVVTGAGSGIGRSTALAFAREGARIAACDVDRARLDALKSELGDRALVVEKIDVADRHQMRTFADQVHALTPAVDVVVNNAGVAVSGTFLEMTLDDWDWILGVNLKGVVHGCHFFIPKMVERGAGGHVINIASIFGIFAPPGVTSYVASKFAVRGFSLSLREELAPHKIGVTATCPGMTNTLIVADAIEGPSGRASTDRAWAERIASALRAALPATPIERGVLAAVAAPVITRERKEALHRTTGALAVDMESHIAAAHAGALGLPFAVCRAIVDPAWRTLPPAATAGLRDDGTTALAPILRELAGAPAQLPELIRLAFDARVARSSLVAGRAALLRAGALRAV